MTDVDALRIAFDPRMRTALDAVLALVIFGVALELRPEDFKAVARAPKGVFAALSCQFLLLPALAFFLGRAMGLGPSMALGMILVASCPGGSISNLLTGLAGGNTALSVSVTAMSTLSSAMLTPLNVAFWGSQDPATSALLKILALDRTHLAFEALCLIGLPLLAGVALCARRPALAHRLLRPARGLSLLLLAAIVVVGVSGNWRVFAACFNEAATLSLVGNATAIVCAYVSTWVIGLSERDRRAVTLEVSVPNTGLALALVFKFFGGLGGMAVVAAFWGLWNLAAGTALAVVWSRALPARAEATA